METQTQNRTQTEQQKTTITINGSNNNNHRTKNMKRSSSSNSDSYTNHDSPHSPLRFHSPLRSDQGDPPDSPPYSSPYTSPQKSPRNQQNSKAIVAVTDKFPQCSPVPEKAVPPQLASAPPQLAGMTVNRAVRGEGAPSMTKVGPGGEGRSGGADRAVESILKRSKTDETVKVANLGFRLSEAVLCLISFSVMAADKTQGWAGDSFDRYREYRRPFDFFMDQVLAYLLISAASASATRVVDWQSNWGKDDFTVMASASVAMAFLAFVAFAFSSLISGYYLCTPEAAM